MDKKRLTSLAHDRYTPKSDEAMKEGREQKEFIFRTLDSLKPTIETHMAGSEEIFRLMLHEDFTGGELMDEARVADIIRLWVFNTYGHALGLERYRYAKQLRTSFVAFRIAKRKSARS